MRSKLLGFYNEVLEFNYLFRPLWFGDNHYINEIHILFYYLESRLATMRSKYGFILAIYNTNQAILLSLD